MTLRWGILGLGAIVERGMAPAFARAADTVLAAVCSRSMEKAKAVAAKYNAAKAYDSYGDMLDDPEVDVVYIATPNNLHAAQTLLAAEAGKHVLCEKPMALCAGDAERMIEACDQHQVKLAVAYQNRYHPAHFEARRHVQAGTLGAVDFASAQLCRGFAPGSRWQSGWRADPAMAGSGAIVAQAVHPVDLLRFLLGSEIVSVQTMTDAVFPGRPIEEMSYSLLEFENGTRATVVSGMRVPRYDNDVLLYGRRAKIVCKATLGVPLAGVTPEFSLQSDTLDVRKNFPSDHALQDKVVRLIEDFNRSVLEGTELGVSGRNGLQMVKIAVAMRESSRHGRAVRIH